MAEKKAEEKLQILFINGKNLILKFNMIVTRNIFACTCTFKYSLDYGMLSDIRNYSSLLGYTLSDQS